MSKITQQLPDAAVTAAFDAWFAQQFPDVTDDETRFDRGEIWDAWNAGGAQGATAERARIIAAGGISQCCGAEYHREPGRYGRFQCHACGEECDLIGTIG